MPGIKKIDFAHVVRNEGCICDRCGQYIQNIWSVTYTDDTTIHFGIDCFDIVCKESRLTSYRMKLLHKAMKRIEKYKKEYQMWLELTEEEAEKRKLIEILKPGYLPEPLYWTGKSFEEYKDWMINEWYPQRFKESQKEIDRFRNINFKKI